MQPMLGGQTQQFRIRHACSRGNKKAARPVRNRSRDRGCPASRAGHARCDRENSARPARLERGGDAFFERIALLARQRVERLDTVRFLRLHGAAECARGEIRDDRARAGRWFADVADEDAAQALRRRSRRPARTGRRCRSIRSGYRCAFRCQSVLMVVPSLRSVSISFSVSLPRALISGTGGRVDGSGPP